MLPDLLAQCHLLVQPLLLHQNFTLLVHRLDVYDLLDPLHTLRQLGQSGLRRLLQFS